MGRKGGSYVVDPKTGKKTLKERTEPAEANKKAAAASSKKKPSTTAA